jgi:hypothetical protein
MLSKTAVGRQAANIGQKVSGGYGRALENIGLRARGTTAGMAQGKMGEASKRIGSLDEDTKSKIASGRKGATAQDRTAAIMDKVKSGKLSDLGTVPQQQQSIAFAQSHLKSRGVDSASIRKDALKSNPNLAANPTELREAVQKQTPGELSKNLDKSAFTPAVLGAMDNKQMNNLFTKGPKAKRDAVSDLVRTPTGRAQIKTHSSTITNPTERAELARNIKLARALTGKTSGSTSENTTATPSSGLMSPSKNVNPPTGPSRLKLKK